MSRIGDMTKGALAMLRGDLGQPTFTWKNAEIPCVPNSLSVGSTLSIGGFDMTVTLALFVTRDNFLSVDSTLISVDSEAYTVDNDKPVPMSGKTVVFRGGTYRIVTTKFTPDNEALTIYLGDKNR